VSPPAVDGVCEECGYPTPRQRSLEWVGRHTLHEAVHHLMDIDRQRGSEVR
jgi:hypothetical protein